jgi:hypothetical protein
MGDSLILKSIGVREENNVWNNGEKNIFCLKYLV